MAKKPSAKPKKKPTRSAKVAMRTKRPGVTKPRAGKSADKYGQPGAPWWKQHLPS